MKSGIDVRVRRPASPSLENPESKVPAVEAAPDVVMNDATVAPATEEVTMTSEEFFQLLESMTLEEFLECFTLNGPTAERISEITDFPALVTFLRVEKCVRVMTHMLRTVFRNITEHAVQDAGVAYGPGRWNTRVFMAAFMIKGHPDRVFERMGNNETALSEAAVKMLEEWEKIVQSLRNGTLTAQDVNVFNVVHVDYLAKFKTWKEPDEARLLGRIRSALCALYGAQAHLPPDDSDSNLAREFRTQVDRLRSKMVQIGGEQALADFDATNPQEAMGVLGGTSLDSFAGTRTSLRISAEYKTNEELAHALLLDPEFTITEYKPKEESLCMRQMMEVAFWTATEEDVRTNSCFLRLVRVVKECVDGMRDMAGNDDLPKLSENLDFDNFKVNVSSGVVSPEDKSAAMVQALYGLVENVKLLQAPRRVAETAELWATHMEALSSAEDRPKAICEAAHFVMGRVNAMRVDNANVRLRLIAPVVRDFGVDYERGKFTEKLKAGHATLDNVRAWLRTFPDSRRDCLDILKGICSGDDDHLRSIYRANYIDLIAGPTKIEYCNLPETMRLDLDCMVKGQAEYRHIVLFSVIMQTLDARFKESLKSIADEEERKTSHAKVMMAASKFLVESEPKESYQDLLSGLLEAMRATGVDSVGLEDLDCIKNLSDCRVVLNFMTSCEFSSHWKDVFVRGEPVSVLYSFANFETFHSLKRLESLIPIMAKVWDLNDKVHIDVYKLTLRQEAAKYIKEGVLRRAKEVVDAEKQEWDATNKQDHIVIDINELENQLRVDTLSDDDRAKLSTELEFAVKERDAASIEVDAFKEAVLVSKAKLAEWEQAVAQLPPAIAV